MTVAVRLTDIERRLSLFANGITGRHHEIRSYDDENAPADAINLPESYAAFEAFADNLGAYRCMTLHQLAYREFGTYTFDLRTACEASPELSARVLRAPAHGSARVSDYDQFYACFSSPAVAQRIFEIIEGHRVDCAMVHRYPGVSADYRRLCAHELGSRPAPPDELLDELIDALVRWTLGAEPDHGLGTDITGIAASVRQVEADVYTSAHATARIVDGLEQLGIVASESKSYEVLDAPATERPSFQGPPPNEWSRCRGSCSSTAEMRTRRSPGSCTTRSKIARG